MTLSKSITNFLISIFIVCSSLGAQDCCDTDTKLVICHTPGSEFCEPVLGRFDNNCEYALDGNTMSGINQKLRNTNNFGPSGTSPCEVELVGLSRNDDTTDEITALGCDVIILGAFGIFDTSFEDRFLDTVKRWSVLCEENLVIAFQIESQAWGYTIRDENQNPNTPNLGSDINIFDGPFGTLASFNQGGTFQANYTQLPSTGATILAVDARNRPTIVLDSLTKDILLADVGIMCSGGAGDISDNRNVVNPNDRLACNIFALGCELANANSLSQEDVFKCPDEIYVLPNGTEVIDEGIYESNLQNIEGCDSTVFSNVLFVVNDPTAFEYIGCNGDSFSLQLNNEIFDQSNPVGSELLMDQFGCDSLVEVNLIYNANTADSQYYETCEGSGFQVQVGNTTFDESNAVGEVSLTNFEGCDSLVTVEIKVLSDTQSNVNLEECAGNSLSFGGVTLVSPLDTTLVIINSEGCDSVINVSLVDPGFSSVSIDSTITVDYGSEYVFQNDFPASYTVSWDPPLGLSCSDCQNPTLLGNTTIENYNLSVTSDDGCVYSFFVHIDYICLPYFSNVFNPTFQDENASFGPQSECGIEEYSMQIYDRYGSLVFSSSDTQERWDGRLNGKDLNQGVYVYLVEYSTNSIPKQVSGSITLLR